MSVSGQNLHQSTEKCSKSEGCELYVNLIIEPITQRFVNISLRTVSQAVRISSMQLPFRVRPFTLISAQDKPNHSALQMLTRYASESRPECSVDGRSVETFDQTKFASLITKCYSVLAKDCSSDQPKFSVLMKNLDNNGKQKVLNFFFKKK